jgi:hypothetical protein
MHHFLAVTAMCLIAGPALAKSARQASSETRQDTSIIEWTSEQTSNGTTLRGIDEAGEAVLEATSNANNIEVCFLSTCRNFDLSAIDENNNPYFNNWHPFESLLLSALNRDFSARKVQMFTCPDNCYRSESVDNTIIALAASTGIFFGPLGGVFVGAGAAMATQQYISNIKTNCTRMGCGPFMRP